MYAQPYALYTLYAPYTVAGPANGANTSVTYSLPPPALGMAPLVYGMQMAAHYGPVVLGPAAQADGAGEQNYALMNKRRIIKRRTRTGCLTCRKRRIKCDERKPHCFNCERLKKLCLGYEVLTASGKRRELEPEQKPVHRSLVHDLL